MVQIWTILKEWLSLPLSDRTLVLMAILLILFASSSTYLFKENARYTKGIAVERNEWKMKYDSLSRVHIIMQVHQLNQELKRTDSLLVEANKIKANISHVIKKVKK